MDAIHSFAVKQRARSNSFAAYQASSSIINAVSGRTERMSAFPAKTNMLLAGPSRVGHSAVFITCAQSKSSV